MFDWLFKKVLGSETAEKFVGTKLATAMAALVAMLINHGLIRSEDQLSAEKVALDIAIAAVALGFMLARAWTDTTYLTKRREK